MSLVTRPEYRSTMRRICTGCLRGFVQETKTSCGVCGAEIRALVYPMPTEVFHRLDDEAKQDLQTRKIEVPKSHPDVLTGDVS
jgi:hypothetical protein